MPEHTERQKELLWLLGYGFSFAVLVSLLWNYSLDDAFISFRYAHNLIRGHGLVYNPGQPPVEGFTNFLWTILVAGLMSLGLEPELTTKYVGVILGLGTLWMTVRLARSLSGETGWRRVAPLLLATCPAFAMHAISGLETQLFTFLFVGGVFLLLPETAGLARLLASGLCFGLCALTRPEGAGLFIIAAGALTITDFGSVPLRSQARRVLPPLAVLLAFLVPFLLWRHAYYGDWLPNTFYAKTGGAEQMSRGWKYIRGFFFEYGGLLFPLLAAFGLLLNRARLLWFCAFAVLGGLVMIFVEGGDWMPLYRMIVHLLPFLFLVAAEGVRRLHDLLAPQGGASRWFAPALCGVIVVLSLLTLRGEVEQAFNKVHRYEAAHRQWGRWLGANTPKGQAIALTDIGQFGYFADKPIIDLAGLTDRYIGRLTGELHFKNIDPDYVYDQKPAFILLVSIYLNDKWILRGFPIEIALANDARLLSEYDGPIRIPYEQDYSYWLFVRKDLSKSLSRLPGNAAKMESWRLPLKE